LIPGPGQTYVKYGKVALFCNPASGGTFSNTAIEILKWVEKLVIGQAKVTRILRPGKASEKTPKGVIPPSFFFLMGFFIVFRVNAFYLYYTSKATTNYIMA
jgi:hypothetical protein